MMSPTYERPFTLGVDLGQANDFTALALIEAQVYFRGPLLDAYPQQGLVVGWNSPARCRPDTLELAAKSDNMPWPGKPPLALRHLERLRGEGYPAVVAHVQQLISQPPLSTLGVK